MRRIYRDDNGRIYTESEDVEFGEDDFGDEDDMGEDDFGDDDLGDDDLGDDDLGEDDLGDDDLGAKKKKARKPRGGSKIRRILMRGSITTNSGTNVFGGAGAATITITPQTWFLATDLIITTTVAAPTVLDAVTSIIFGDRLVWNDPVGVPITAFAAGSQLRGVLRGHIARPNSNILVATTASAASTQIVTVFGRKPRQRC